jgi:hypothetical protein
MFAARASPTPGMAMAALPPSFIGDAFLEEKNSFMTGFKRII